MKMFDEKGECKYCGKPTRARSTSLCNACYKLDLAIKNNPNAAEKILENYKDIKPQKKMWDEEGTHYPYASEYYVPDPYTKPYRECRPKENQ